MEDTSSFFNPDLMCIDSEVVQRIENLWSSAVYKAVRPRSGPQAPARDWFLVLVCNLVLAGNDALAIPLDKAAVEYEKGRYNKAGLTHNCTKYPDRLAEAGEIDVHKGSFEAKMRTTVRPAGELLALVRSLMPLAYVIRDDLEPVEIRGAGRRRLDYDDTQELVLWRQTLLAHSKLMSRYKVTFRPSGTEDPVLIPSQNLGYRRLFTRSSWDCGGRLYCHSVQNLRRRKVLERQSIQFSDAPTTEPDYSGQHPRMLYICEGAPRADKDDMYEAWMHVELSKKAASISDADRRGLAKELMLCAFNAKTREDACSVATHALDDDPLIPKKDTKQLYRAMQHHHVDIAHYFGDDIGIRLQRVDSDIMLLVLAEMTQRGLPCLPVHDSVICRVEDEALTVGIMSAASAFYLGIPLPVKAEADGVDVQLSSALYRHNFNETEAAGEPLGLLRLRQQPQPIVETERERQKRLSSQKRHRGDQLEAL